MEQAWAEIGTIDPKTLVEARLQAHHAVQWLTKAARANLAPEPDDGQSSFLWDATLDALTCRALESPGGGEVRFALALAPMRLVLVQEDAPADELMLDGKRDAEAGAWIDGHATSLGLKPTCDVALSYKLAAHPLAKSAAYTVASHQKEFVALAVWYAAAAELLEETRASLARIGHGPSLVRCWPHHFDIATLLTLGEGDVESAAAIGIGVSPGDEHYAEPYFYVSPSPRPKHGALPPLPPSGHWHEKDFLGAVAPASALLAAPDKRETARRFLNAAIAAARELLDAG
jgi:hypothetical protein